MQEKDPFTAYQYVMNSHPRGMNETIPIVNSCNRPWKTVTIDMYTNCMLCICDGWIPVPVGEITDFERLEEIWTNPIAQQIQQNITDKKFSWCAVDHCGIKYRSHNEPMYQLIFGIDDSCNLQCPSCRRELRMHTSGPLYEKKSKAVQHAVELLHKFEPQIHITLACSGDPLASYIYRHLLHGYKGKSSQTFTLFTNGLLIKKQLDKTDLLDRINEFRISVDAGSKDVYEKVRVGGNWEVLIDNLDFLQQRNLGHFVNLMYVVQKNNYKDIQNFADLLDRYNFRGILTQLDDWGTWNYDTVQAPDTWTIKHGTYLENNVLDSAHPMHQDCKESVIAIKNHPRIFLTPRIQQLVGIK